MCQQCLQLIVIRKDGHLVSAEVEAAAHDTAAGVDLNRTGDAHIAEARHAVQVAVEVHEHPPSHRMQAGEAVQRGGAD